MKWRLNLKIHEGIWGRIESLIESSKQQKTITVRSRILAKIPPPQKKKGSCAWQKNYRATFERKNSLLSPMSKYNSEQNQNKVSWRYQTARWWWWWKHCWNVAQNLNFKVDVNLLNQSNNFIEDLVLAVKNYTKIHPCTKVIKIMLKSVFSLLEPSPSYNNSARNLTFLLKRLEELKSFTK